MNYYYIPLEQYIFYVYAKFVDNVYGPRVNGRKFEFILVLMSTILDELLDIHWQLLQDWQDCHREANFVSNL